MLPKVSVGKDKIAWYRMNEAQRKAKENTYIKILKVLAKETKPLRWKELIKKTMLSSRTLSDRLKDLQVKGLVRRIISDSEYPPAALYEISSRGKLAQSEIGDKALFYKQFEEEWLFNRRAYFHLIQNGEIDRVIEFMAENFFIEFLMYLKYCFKKPEYA